MDVKRVKKLQDSLKNPLLIKKKENLLYLTGRSFMHGYLLVKPRKDAEFNAEGRGKPSVVFLGDGLEKVEGLPSDFLKNVGKYVSPKQTLEVFGQFTYSEVKYIKFKNPKLKIKVIVEREPADYIRQVKDSQEISYVRKSMQIVEQVFKQVRKEIKKPGMTEIKLSDFIKSAGLKLGADEISFPPIVAAGEHASTPHHVPDKYRLRPNQSIIIDFGFKYKGYCSDFTRTVFLKSVPKRLEMAYNQVENAYNESIEFINVAQALGLLQKAVHGPALQADDVYQKSVEVLKEKHLDKYFIHSLGHGTGLEIHELPNLSPKSKDVLQNGMVFSIEPGAYFPKLGGIRIEDLVYLKKGKVRKFIDVPTNLKNNIIL